MIAQDVKVRNIYDIRGTKLDPPFEYLNNLYKWYSEYGITSDYFQINTDGSGGRIYSSDDVYQFKNSDGTTTLFEIDISGTGTFTNKIQGKELDLNDTNFLDGTCYFKIKPYGSNLGIFAQYLGIDYFAHVAFANLYSIVERNEATGPLTSTLITLDNFTYGNTDIETAIRFVSALTDTDLGISSGYILFGTEQEWTTATSTQDAYYKIKLALNGTLVDRFHIASDGTTTMGDIAGENTSQIESDGTLRFNGTATVYNDLQFSVGAGKVPAAHTPNYETFTTNTKEYSFAVNDYIDLASNEVPHSWKLATSGDLHLHVTTKGANSTGGDVFAKFTIYISYAQPTGVWVETPFTAELTIPNGTSALQFFYLDIGDIDLTGFGLSTQIKPRVVRIAATGGTEYSGNIFINQFGIHMQEDTVGSRTESTK